MKLAAKFARQEREPERLARIARRRIRGDRVEAVRRMLGLADEKRNPHTTEPPKSWTDTESEIGDLAANSPQGAPQASP
jgi:hypothetical protein